VSFQAAAASSCQQRADGYARHRPEETLLYRVIERYWPTFLARAEEEGGLPRFVEREFEEYLRCGRLEHGHLRLACMHCGEPMVAAFSCKRRGFCPSCLGRRMNDLAAHLIDDVLPKVPVRQWVCSLPWRLRYTMGYDRRLCADVLGAFVGALTRSQKRRAKRLLGLRSLDEAQIGALTFVQRSDSALRLNVHFHTLALDGVYVRDSSDELVFEPLPPPTAEEVATVATETYRRLERVLERHGRSLDGLGEEPDRLQDEQPVLATCYGASAADRQLLGAAPGHKTDKLIRPVSLVSDPTLPLAEVGGVNIHAAVAVDGRDRKRLERLCRYVARPPLALDRLEDYGDGRLAIRFKVPWKDGTTAVLLDPLDLLTRLCALIPPPRFHMLRYHGVLAGHANARAEVVPGRLPPRPAQLPLPEFPDAPTEQAPPSRYPWAALLARVFAVDIATCPRCGGSMRLLEVVTESAIAAPPRARAPPPHPRQLPFLFPAPRAPAAPLAR
jgi:hypothetical protein